MDKKKQPPKKKAIQAKTVAQKTAGEAGAGRPMVNIDAGAGKMRKQAEKMARKDVPDVPEDLSSLSPEVTEKLLHELRMHQIELEVQNEELRTAQAELEKVRAQYFELYDLAPVGYFSISEKGMILEANLTGASLLGVLPNDLRTRPFSNFILEEDRKIYYQNRKRLLETRKLQTFEIRMVGNGSQFWAEVQADLSKAAKGGTPVCHAMISDITERKRAEEALRANEVKLDNALRSVQMGVWSLEIIGNKRIFDDQTCHLLGLNPAKFGGTAEEFFSAIHPDDREKIRAALIQTIEKDVLYEPSYRVVWPDGSVHHICARGRLILDDHGRPLRISGIIWDITESKLAEEALKIKQIMLQRTEGIAHIGSWEWDVATDTVTWSDELYRIFQRDPQEGAPSFAKQPALYHPDDFAILRQAVEGAIADGTPYALELRTVRKDGEIRVCMARGVAEKALSGQVVRLVGSVQDITKRKMAEVALKESEEKYRMVVENAHEAIVIAVNGVNKFANRKITELTGYTREEITARPFIEFVHPDDRQMVATRYQQRLKGEDIPDTYSFRIVDKLGYIKWVELSAASITWEGKTGTLNFVIDITDRKRLEEERQRVGKLESVGVLAGGIAHDFNNILTSILGNVSMAKMEVEPSSETYKSLEQAEKASQRARDLTKQLLTFSKGGSPVTKLASLTQLLRDTAGFALRGSNVKCNFSIPADLWHAEIDAGQVSQVIQNLVINAQQAMPTGGTIEISAENVTLSATQSLGRGLPLAAGNYIRIAVIDHGDGIASEHLDKVFDPFFTTKQKGSGLGLATSFSIARQHKGHLSVETQAGAGSTFFLYLPASLDTVRPETAEKQKIKPAGQARILVMDDEQEIKEVAGRMLTMIGYKDVEFATDGAEAIQMYKAAIQSGKPFSLAILDLTIPGGMGGREAIQKLLKIDPGVKAIVSSGYHDDVVIAKYKEHGFSGMVVKPYTVEQLGKALEDALG